MLCTQPRDVAAHTTKMCFVHSLEMLLHTPQRCALYTAPRYCCTHYKDVLCTQPRDVAAHITKMCFLHSPEILLHTPQRCALYTASRCCCTHHKDVLCTQPRDVADFASCSHEEADTIILFHVEDAVRQGLQGGNPHSRHRCCDPCSDSSWTSGYR